MIRILVDRSRAEEGLALAATSLLFALAFVAESRTLRGEGLVVGGLLGLGLAGVGFWTTSRVRPLSPRPFAARLRLAVLSLCAGAVAGALILLQLLVLSALDPVTPGGVVGEVSQPLSEALWRAYGAAVVEETAIRLFGMGGIAWFMVRRYGKEPEEAFRTALLVSALMFGLGHLAGLSLAALTLVLFNALGGILLGWIFWRWGLPYAILCHFVAGVLIQGLGPGLLA